MAIVRVYDRNPGKGPVDPARQRPGGDLFGRYSDCMVMIEVEDTQAPRLIRGAANRTVVCTDADQIRDLGDNSLTALDAPIFADACDVDVVLQTVSDIDECGDGTITRVFTATDRSPKQNRTTARQVITVRRVVDFAVRLIDDVEVSVCDGTDAFDAAIDTELTEADVDDLGCSPLLFGFEDKNKFGEDRGDAICGVTFRTYWFTNRCVATNFQLGDPAVIVRNLDGLPAPSLTLVPSTSFESGFAIRAQYTPTVIRFYEWNGAFQYTQVIDITDETNPVITDGANIACSPEGQTVVNGLCQSVAGTSFTVTDECTNVFDVTAQVYGFVDAPDGATVTTVVNARTGVPVPSTLRQNADGSYTVIGSFPLGRHAVVVEARDRCGNPDVRALVFDAVDCKAPTPRFDRNGAGIMQTGGLVLTAASLDDSNDPSSDNCGTVKLLVKRAGEPRSAAAEQITLTCDDLGTNTYTFIVVDEAGNEDFVDVLYNLQDQNNVCGQLGARIVTDITDVKGNGVDGALVSVNGTSITAVTVNGNATIPVAAGGDVTIKAELNEGHLNGVNTNDFVVMGRNLLGTVPFTSFAQQAAADVDGVNGANAYDITVARRVLLGREAGFRSNTSWRFFNADDFSQEAVSLNNVEGEVLVEMLAVKVGDVDGSARANANQPLAPRTVAGTFELVADEAVLAAGETHIVTFNASDAAVLGYQGTIEFDAAALEVVALRGGAHTAGGFGAQNIAAGEITMSYNGDMTEELFALEVRALRDGVALSEVLSVTSAATPAAAYAEEGEQKIALRFGNTSVATGYALGQNRPNPFNGSTVIGFELAEAGEARLAITDAAGRVVFTVTGDYAAGANNVEIAASDLPGAGVLSYTLTAGEFTATRKMVVVK